MKLSLKLRVALAVAGVVAVLGVAIRLFVERRLVADMERDLDSRALALAQNLAAESVEPILYQDAVRLDVMLATARAAWSDFEYAYVLDATHNVVAHTLTGEFPNELRRLNRHRGGPEPQLHQTRALGFDYRDVAVPIYRGSLGVLHLGFKDQSISERFARLRREIVTFLAILAACGAAFVYFLTYRGLRPLGVMVDMLERFQPGRTRSEIPTRQHDEIGAVASRVNTITLRLHEAQIALDKENRLATLGRFASVIAHEVGNPLASITTRLDLMERSTDEGFLHDSVPLLRGQLARIQAFLHGLSRLSRAQQASSCTCDVNAVIREAADMLRFDPRAAHIDLRLNLGRVPPIRCAHDQLFQVLVNLGLNGLRAAGPSGWLSVATGLDGDRVYVEVEDSGPGVAPEHQKRIFEPFFSTEPDGTGLGLAISRDLMRQQGGDLRLIAGGGSGACFRIRLRPALEGESTCAAC